MMRAPLPLLMVLATLCLASIAGADTACISCHSNPDYFDGDLVEIVSGFESGVHAEVGLSCHDCHGGNPDPNLADDTDAMDPTWPGSPYTGKPARTDIPGFCGRCHSDPTFMKRFRPDARIDQEREYWTSKHGEALQEGDLNVATCTDCHSVHGIRRVADPDATVYPTRVGETCGRCHADANRMAGYTDGNGRPLRVDQLARWSRSVHAESMFEKEDLSAPTCNDCHGNHGAAPPGLESVSFVCGQCHGREAELFRASSKHDGFEEHNEYLSEAGEEGCAACHESPQADLELASFSECATCHGNHGVVRPTIAMLSSLPATPCEFCHFGGSGEGEPSASLRRQADARTELLMQAEGLDLDGLDLFDWLVDRAATLPEHTVSGDVGTDTVMRPEFAELFRRFRIGRSYSTYLDPQSGEEVPVASTRCDDCHSAASDSPGATTAAAMLRMNQELMSATAQAERTLLAAKRGGVEVGEVLSDVEHAIDAEIGLAALVHTFSVEDDSAFAEQHAEGMEAARSALENGHQALGELSFRRKGLGVSLVVILILLVALGLKIREISP